MHLLKGETGMRLTRALGVWLALLLAIIAPAMTLTQADASTPSHPTWVTGTSGGTTEMAKDLATSMLTDNDVGWVLVQPTVDAKILTSTMYTTTNAVLAGQATATTGSPEATPLRDTGQPVTTTANMARMARSTQAVHRGSAWTNPTTAMTTAPSRRQSAIIAGTKIAKNDMPTPGSSRQDEAKVTKALDRMSLPVRSDAG